MVAVPSVVGMMLGARIGARLLNVLKGSVIRRMVIARAAVRRPARAAQGHRGVAMKRRPTKTAVAASRAEQLRYARLLDWGTRVGLLVLVLSFAAYVTGLDRPHVPLEQLPALWGQPVAAYLQQTAVAHRLGLAGAGAPGRRRRPLGIAMLAGCSLPCLLALVPLYLRRGDRAFVALCLAAGGAWCCWRRRAG